jgi:hypothetical protein
MRESSGHLRKVYKLLWERTGIQLPQVEEFLDSL